MLLSQVMVDNLAYMLHTASYILLRLAEKSSPGVKNFHPQYFTQQSHTLILIIFKCPN